MLSQMTRVSFNGQIAFHHSLFIQGVMHVLAIVRSFCDEHVLEWICLFSMVITFPLGIYNQ